MVENSTGSSGGQTTALTNETPTWHTLSGETIAQQLEVDPAQGLSSAKAGQRLQQYGPNVLSEEEKEPTWLAFLKQYKDYMRIVLTVAAVASLLIGEFGTALLLLIITAGNAYMALRQERSATRLTLSSGQGLSPIDSYGWPMVGFCSSSSWLPNSRCCSESLKRSRLRHNSGVFV